jgi:transcriptional regulator with XRE-family HTH domain
MPIGHTIRRFREQKGLSQGDIERASGLPRSYVSRVENELIVPSLETLYRFAAALDIPLYRLFCPEGGDPKTPHLTPRRSLEGLADDPKLSGAQTRLLLTLKGLAGKMVEGDRAFLLHFLQKLAAH